MIQLFATGETLTRLIPEVAERQRAVLESGRYILGPEVEAFESEFASYVGRRYCVAVANGTEALTIGLRALGIVPGDEVIVPAMSFFATVEAVVNAGATPVFADVDPDTHCVSAAQVEPLIGERTRAIIPVHLFGNPAPMAELWDLGRAHDIRILEDAAQATGARIDGRMAGALGDAASFSFYPAKTLGAFGDAGAIVTDDANVDATARRLRVHGASQRWIHTEVGFNSRLDELQAAGLRVVLPHLDQWIRARRDAADLYRQAGLGKHVTTPIETDGAESAYHLYVVSTARRDSLAAALGEARVETRAYYTTPLHLQPAMAQWKPKRALPNAERISAEGLALPMGPALDNADVETVVEAIGRALGQA